jgi:aquaporin related protein
MVLVGALTPLRGALLTISQILGGITGKSSHIHHPFPPFPDKLPSPSIGAAIIDALTPGTLNVRTSLAPGVSVARGLFIEMFMTAMLMITM